MVSGSDESSKVMSKDEFSECVENINVLNLRLKNADDRCQRMRTDLRLSKQVCDVTSPPPPPPPPLLLSSLLSVSPVHEHRWLQQESEFSFPVSSDTFRHISNFTHSHLARAHIENALVYFTNLTQLKMVYPFQSQTDLI